MVASEFNRILVPLDGSPTSEQILTPAASLAHSTGSSMVLVQVAPTGGSIRRMTAHLFRRSNTQARLSQQIEIANHLRGLAEVLRSRGIAVTIDTAHDEITEEIVAMGTRHQASIIAMCTHGRTGLRRLAPRKSPSRCCADRLRHCWYIVPPTTTFSGTFHGANSSCLSTVRLCLS